MAGTEPDRRRTLLARSLLFSQLAPRDLDAVLAVATIRRLAEREIVFHKGDPAERLYGILTGSLRATAPGPEGHELVLRMMPAGEFCGEVALFDGGSRSATVSTNERTELLVIERADLLALIESRPRLALPLLAALATRLRALTEEFEDATFLSLPQRLAKKLISLLATHGEEAADGQRIGLALSQEQLGAMVGTSRESINKLLRMWKETEIVRHEAGFVHVRSTERLGRIARGEE